MKAAVPSLHPVTAAAADDLADLRVRAMRESLEAIGRFDVERARARLLDSFAPAATREIRLQTDRVGFLVVRPQAGYWNLEHLYVEPRAQGQRIGGWALQTVLAEADKACMRVQLGALKESRSNAFYVRHGFTLLSTDAWDNYYFREPERVA